MRPDYVQLATDLNWRDVVYPVTVEPKIDGCRCIVVVAGGAVRCYSRRGTGWIAVAAVVADLSRFDGRVFDGEIVVGGTWGRTNGAIHRLSLSAAEVASARFHAFDCLTADEYAAGRCDRPQDERRATLLSLLTDLPADSRVVAVGSISCESRAEVDAEYRRIVAAGGEGVVVKDPGAPYQIGRSPAWGKLKPQITDDWADDSGRVVEGIRATGVVLRVREDRVDAGRWACLVSG